jgi:hypothetical protein
MKKNLTKMLFVLLAAVLLVSTVAALIPRAVHALTAELVQNVDSPPRNAWVGTCSINTTASFGSCTIPVPAGQTVTIQTMTFLGTAVNHEHMLIDVSSAIGPDGELAVWTNQIVSVVGITGFTSKIDQFYSSLGLTLYATGGQGPITVSISTDGPNPVTDDTDLGGNVFLVGYTVNTGTPSSN